LRTTWSFWRLLAQSATAAGNRSVSAIDRPLDTAVLYGVLDFFIPWTYVSSRNDGSVAAITRQQRSPALEGLRVTRR
jgi:hypothetical protein